MEIKFRFFRISPYMNLWKYIKDIRELQKQGVIEEECPSATYWEFRIKKFYELPEYLKKEIISNNAYLE